MRIPFSKPMDWGTESDNESGFGSSLALEDENNLYLDAAGPNDSVKGSLGKHIRRL